MLRRIIDFTKRRASVLALAALVALASFGAPQTARAQQGSIVQQSGSRLDAGVGVAVGTNWNTVNTQSTATVTPPSGYYVYVTALYMGACQSATGGAVSNVNFTTTGLGSGATASPQFPLSQPSAVSSCAGQPGLVNFATPLKSAIAGQAVTLVSPSAAAQTGFATEIFYYLAP